MFLSVKIMFFVVLITFILLYEIENSFFSKTQRPC